METFYSAHLHAARLFCILCVFLASPRLSADQIHFVNGESLSGVLQSVEDGRVRWQSAVLGELMIEQRQVQWIETGERYDLKTSGSHLSNCWMYIQGELQHLHCDEGVETLKDWRLVVSAGETISGAGTYFNQRGGIIVAAENSTGNTDITKYNVDARTELRYIESRHTIAMRYQEESAEGQSTRNMWRTSYQYDKFFTQQWFATGVGFYEEDEFRELDQRGSIGAGMGYQFLETPYFNLLGKGTLNYVDEQFSNGEERQTPAFLWNLDFGWKVNDEGVELFHRHVLLQAFDSGDDWEVSTVTGLKYPINGNFSSVLQLEYDYDNLPAQSQVEKKDQTWSIGLNYNWY